jgi:hypothetical protein
LPSRIADSLFGKARQRVLALLFGAPERRAFVRQIARLAGTGLGSVQRELARMTSAGLLIREREGHQTYYRANPDSPVINELRDLMRKTAGAADLTVLSSVRSKRNAILAAAAKRGVRNVRLFGSIARGEARPDSDADFLVDLDRGRSLLDLAGLVMDLESLLGRRVDVVTPAGLRPRIRESVLKDARPL